MNNMWVLFIKCYVDSSLTKAEPESDFLSHETIVIVLDKAWNIQV